MLHLNNKKGFKPIKNRVTNKQKLGYLYIYTIFFFLLVKRTICCQLDLYLYNLLVYFINVHSRVGELTFMFCQKKKKLLCLFQLSPCTQYTPFSFYFYFYFLVINVILLFSVFRLCLICPILIVFVLVWLCVSFSLFRLFLVSHFSSLESQNGELQELVAKL